MDRVRLNHSVFYNEEEVRELENLAAEGNVEAGIEVAARQIEDGINTEENFAFLEEQCKKNNPRAFVRLGLVYVGENNDELAEEYFLKGAELGSAWAMMFVGTHKWYKVWMDGGKDATEQDFIDAEKWLRLSVEASKKPDNDINESGVVQARDQLSMLYGYKHPKNSVYNPEKAKEWEVE